MKIKNNYIALECTGHTGFAKFGKDILCSAISAIVQTGGIGMVEVLDINANIERQDETGYYKLQLPKNLSEGSINQAQIIFKTMFKSLNNLQKEYSKYIKLEVIDAIN